jgi:hypothetical protein
MRPEGGVPAMLSGVQTGDPERFTLKSFEFVV